MNPFLIPKDPLLRWSCLRPKVDREPLPPPFNTSRVQHVFWGRNAIYHGLKALGITRADTVLVPAYHCAAAIEPIVRYGAHVIFYNVRRDCTPDFEDIRTKITPSTKAVMVIHYFGFPQPMRAWQDLCAGYNLKLIEDCAHVLTGEVDGKTLGTFGDVSVFSLRKFFPIYDGGQLLINDRSNSYAAPTERTPFLFALKVAKNTLDKLTEDSPGWFTRSLSGFVHLPSAIVRRVLSTGVEPSTTLSISSHGVEFDHDSLRFPMTGMSRYLMRNSYSSGMVEQRRANYQYLLDRLQSFRELEFPFPVLPKNIAPLVFPVVMNEEDNFHLLLRDRGIPATTWGGVIHDRLLLGQFPDAQWLYKRLLCLPIHQDIRPRDMDLMVNVMGDSLSARRGGRHRPSPEPVSSNGASPLVRSHMRDV